MFSCALTEVIVDACVLQIHSLVRRPEHNGKIARLLDYSREKDRWVKSIWVKSICSSSTHFQFPIRRAICVAASDVLNARQTECEGVRKYACAASRVASVRQRSLRVAAGLKFGQRFVAFLTGALPRDYLAQLVLHLLVNLSVAADSSAAWARCPDEDIDTLKVGPMVPDL